MLIDRGLNWQDLAACAKEDPEIFYPEKRKGSRAIEKMQRQAKQICASCPVQVRCLEDSFAAREEFGIWGGVTEQERERLLSRQRGRLAG